MTSLYLDTVDRAVCADISETVLDEHRSRYGLNTDKLSHMVIDITNPDIKELQKEEFDTILCVNVLEHIENDREAIENMRSIVMEGGRIILFVPAMSFLYSFMDENTGHFRRYDKDQLKSMGLSLGMQCVYQRYFNFFGIPVFYLKKIMGSKKEGTTFSNLVTDFSSKLINSATVILKPIEKRIPPVRGVAEIIVFEK